MGAQRGAPSAPAGARPALPARFEKCGGPGLSPRIGHGSSPRLEWRVSGVRKDDGGSNSTEELADPKLMLA